MNDKLTYSVRRLNKVAIIDLKGKIIGSWACTLKDEIEHLHRSGVSTIILNCQGVTSIDSLGVMALAEGLGKGLTIRIVNLTTSCQEFLKQSRIANAIPIFYTEEDALKDLDIRKPPEKRRYERVNTNIPVEIFLANNMRRGVLLNISEGGALVGYLDPLNIESQGINKINIKMKLPFLGSIELEGQPVRFSRTSEMHVIGIQLLSPEKGKRVFKEVFKEKRAQEGPPV